MGVQITVPDSYRQNRSSQRDSEHPLIMTEPMSAQVISTVPDLECNIVTLYLFVIGFVVELFLRIHVCI